MKEERLYRVQEKAIISRGGDCRKREPWRVASRRSYSRMIRFDGINQRRAGAD